MHIARPDVSTCDTAMEFTELLYKIQRMSSGNAVTSSVFIFVFLPLLRKIVTIIYDLRKWQFSSSKKQDIFISTKSIWTSEDQVLYQGTTLRWSFKDLNKKSNKTQCNISCGKFDAVEKQICQISWLTLTVFTIPP